MHFLEKLFVDPFHFFHLLAFIHKCWSIWALTKLSCFMLDSFFLFIEIDFQLFLQIRNPFPFKEVFEGEMFKWFLDVG